MAVLREEAAFVEAPAQAEALARLRAAGGRLRVSELVRGRSSLRSALTRLEKRGVIRLEDERDVRQPSGLALKEDVKPDLLPEQEEAALALTEAMSRGGFAPFLLHGVTGSGKTEVYFRAADAALGLGKGVLILVPEIALTPMLVRAAASRFGATVSVQHSELSAGERHDQWWRIREGEARVVIGARSAVFAPLPAAGLIVVDEEHEAAYKQEESPRYHARDVAVMRGTLEGAVVLLGSATPSVESHTNALKGKYRRLSLATRIGAHGLPRVEVIDRRARSARRGRSDPEPDPPGRTPGAPAAERAGPAPAQPPGLRHEPPVPRVRSGGGLSELLRVPHPACGRPSGAMPLLRPRRAAPAACIACRGVYLRLSGYGTEQVVEVVRAALPDARIARVDEISPAAGGPWPRPWPPSRRGGDRHPGRDPDDRQGSRFPGRDPCGGHLRRRRLNLPDFRSRGAHLPASDPGGGRAGRADLRGRGAFCSLTGPITTR